MELKLYLKQYNIDEDRALHWIRMNGGEPAIARVIMDTWSHWDRKHHDSLDFSQELLRETLAQHDKPIKDLLANYKKLNFKPPFKERFKLWRWIRGR